MTPERTILAALAAAGPNVFHGPHQTQMLLFLLDQETAHDFGGPHFEFSAQGLDPHSAKLDKELLSLVSEGMLQEWRKETRLPNGTTQLDSYPHRVLTPEGYEAGSAVLEELPPKISSWTRKISKWTRELDFQQLTASICRDYPEMGENLIFQPPSQEKAPQGVSP